ncbi:methyltransferase domain-containing protein [Candidatus Daviesbacteria bacterium]|nr:methyltransferase domain-containing protein [Candidatus Daviesbacteria bacterium]
MKSHRLYDHLYHATLKWPYIYHAFTQIVSGGHWEKWQNRVLDDLTGKHILEIGPGPGKLLLKLAKKGYTVAGVEIRPGMAYEARRRLKGAGFDVDIFHQSAHKLPFKNETFDCIVGTFVMSEIEDLDEAIKEMKRVLKKKGKVIIIAGSVPQNNNFMARLIFRLINIGSIRPFGRDNAEYFQKHGFEVKRHDFGPFNMINKVVAAKE